MNHYICLRVDWVLLAVCSLLLCSAFFDAAYLIWFLRRNRTTIDLRTGWHILKATSGFGGPSELSSAWKRNANIKR